MTEMNLGDANLRTVNSSRPRLIHVDSKQSITASDDYYSLGSDESSAEDRTVVRRYETPPLQIRSGVVSRDHLQSEATIPTIRQVKPSPPEGAKPAPAVVKFEEGQEIKRKPVSGAGMISQRTATDNNISPTTPGLDDMPYIRFAIDQLTRDEELLGSRRQGAASEASYPVDRIIPDEGLGYYGHGGRSTRHDREPPNPPVAGSEPSPTNGVLLPVEPVHDSFRYPKLNFVPRALRPFSLAVLILLCLLMITALIFCNVWSSQHNGLWQYDGVGTSRYFVFQFLPQLLASLIILWLLVIQSAIQRVFPFSVLASGKSTLRNSSIFDSAVFFPSNLLIPNIACFKCGEPALGSCYIIFWLSLFTVPLQSCLFQTRYYTNEDIWQWTVFRPVGWTLLVLYVLLVVALIIVMFRFLLHQTGLKWDPVSIADILVLFHRSNILSDFDSLEVDTNNKALVSKTYKLGYWMTSNRPDEAFYGIGEDHAPVHRYSLEGGKMKSKEPAFATQNYDLEGQQPMKTTTLDSLQTNIHSSNVRYRWLPWFLKDTFVVAWIVIAIVLMIAFIIVSFVNQPVKNGFLPLLPAPTNTQGFSPANFLYSFIPSLLGMTLFLLWQPIDFYFRALQPFATLSSTRGTTAENSLLLDYTACLPIEITIKAALAGHYKVAYISFISLISITLPILAGGIFTALFFIPTHDVRIAASLPAYYALIVFVIIYALSFLAIWPSRKRRLPHDIRTLGQLISFVYQSPLLSDAAFREPRSRIDLVTRLLGAPVGERSKPRYAFGVFQGRDEREHLGIDRLQRPGSGEMLVTTGTLGK